MAEAHPVAFRWVMKARERGATVIHVDPRFSRTSAMADVHVPIRAGSDIAFVGGLIRHVIETGSYFRDYVVNYTNAATLINEKFQDTEDLGGLFSGWDPESGTYDPTTWAYEGGEIASAAGQREHATQAFEEKTGAGMMVGARQARRDARAPALRVPDPAAALLALHARGRRADLRHLTRAVPAGGRGADPQLGPRADLGARLRGRLDASTPPACR